ncbi:glycerol-3-phosphate 1-O-acyltransferase PlsY [Crocosphaera sp. UHCC 0190]|uniref:glycerol-3-phosphate 1-O-acyltransferase PlsY n=1 Tax=Crocosphaera sp. UHCC 0190 TaxID=3110246 RepID=UPI002B1EFC10|nr:glycerol-3-phosphate 1-O-acyltransferase PlsY [Crocosphaera sp. UHCC 0190]MEA5510275.1 glycerol-3-phosphate 1-O-acyltransferase PlsY [Crocosphaera sp. UHCC 0190]
MAWLISALLILVDYLLGSIPTGYFTGLYLEGIDIREHGSGSTGATNVLRTIGKRAAIFVLTVDLAKAMLAVVLIKLWFFLSPVDLVPLEWKSWLMVFGAIAAVLGHSKSIFLNFTGGKSVAASLGVLLVLNPIIALGTLGSFLAMLAISRIVSLSSITGVIAVNIMMVALNQPLPYCLFGVIVGIYVIVRHRTNIIRLLEGTEPRIGQKLQKEEAKPI